jgi:probable H4MPT-linked C1 transfer pathway protein
MNAVIGWDIGGVNTKVTRVVDGSVTAVRSRAFELQRDPAALVPLLRELASEVGAEPSDVHALTMTAELSQMFRTKRDGVSFVLDAVESAFPSSRVQVFAVEGRFLSPGAARREPLAVAAANWSATANQVARTHPDALLVDIGTTSTDIIPIVGGRVVAKGLTDPDRLASGELVYTGALRTPAEAMAGHVPLGDAMAGVSAEGFAFAGDVHVWRGNLAPDDYTCPTPDGRPAAREFAGERLARVVCADREMLDDRAISAIADALAHTQIARVADAMKEVARRHPSLRTAVVTGLGAFIAAAAARSIRFDVVSLADALGDEAARCAPAASVALLFEYYGATSHPVATHRGTEAPRNTINANPLGVSACPAEALRTRMPRCVVETVVKIGGGMLADAAIFERALAAIADAARTRRMLIVPGGGPFADAVRDVDRRLDLSDEAAHWMAILAMDQYAHLLVSRLPSSVLVHQPHEIRSALEAERLPVLAPSAWIRQSDPLPHSWDVTSDSIAAWIAGEVGARSLVLVKPPLATGDVVDAYFTRALPAGMTPMIVHAHQIETLRDALAGAGGEAV